MAIRIEVPEGEEALTEFLVFHDRVYAERGAAWPAFVPLQLPILAGESAFACERRIRPLVAREGGDIVARVVAVVDDVYQRHWRDGVGHLDWFEALPGAREATRRLMDAACEWLRAQGMRAARAGFGLFELPFVIDDYESLPPSGMRQNPAYYHPLLKDAGFETERAAVDYKIRVTPELVGRWESAVEGARRGGFELVPLGGVPKARRVADFTATWNDAFRAHWALTPYTEERCAALMELLAPTGMLDTSVLAYRDGRPVGVVHVAPELAMTAAVRPGRVLRDDERLNFLGIGVRKEARGRGVNLAMAAAAYLELVRRGATWLSYTLVLDDNWPSRRTAEKLGAAVCANYVVYRRNLTRGAQASGGMVPG